jgi:hypothetical protein
MLSQGTRMAGTDNPRNSWYTASWRAQCTLWAYSLIVSSGGGGNKFELRERWLCERFEGGVKDCPRNGMTTLHRS